MSQSVLHSIGKLLQVARLIDEEIFNELPHQQWEMLLYVIQNEGIGQLDFQKLLGVPAGTVSRNLSKLGIKVVEDRNGNRADIGYGLIDIRPDREDPKRNSVFLSKKGQEFKEKLLKIVSC